MAPKDNASQAPSEGPTAERPAGIPAWIWLSGAVLVLLSLLTGLQTRQLQGDLTELQDRLREQRMRGLALSAERQRHENALAILTSPNTREFELRPSIGRTTMARIRVFWNDEKGLLMIGSHLSLPRPKHVFQLWVTMKDGTQVDCGMFRPGADRQVRFLVAPKVGLKEAQALWITEEPEGGSAQPTSPPLWKATIR